MIIIYKYLFVDLGLALIWLILFKRWKNLRKEMFFSSVLYPLILTPLFFIVKGLSCFWDVTWRYVPDYFNPDTLFNLSRITGGFAIEDLLFMFFAGGIISIVYEIIFKKTPKKAHKKKYILSIVIFFITYIFITFIFKFNPIYNLIISSFIGFLVLIIQRNDLIQPSIYGGLAFTIFYLIAGIIFILIFPDTMFNFWTFSNISRITVFNFPIEELLYAFSFGLMWGPMYEYLKGYRDE